ncbi:conserved hypothetical protein [Sphingobium sp. SYK-6]|uniref:hypothetical protein n=1 Tax=Sphingobium sp. (strain NBRC 103272 / SYK-6) TaxID=627192 RepID=UPI00022770BD|nr:hypothetical protein [Sphingobium sp. SYK-6]BAK66869.1 conserved hypothetical protein [Sphingobium sp. SYK-6]
MAVHEVISDFLDFMASEGVAPTDSAAFISEITCGNVIRFDCVGERRGSKNGWAKLYLDARPAGAFGNWKMGINRRWSSGTANELSPAERRALREEWDRNKARREALRIEAQQGAARDAAHIWSTADRASPEHPYAARKRLNVAPLRQHGSELLVPMYDDEGAIWNIQRIFEDGKKLFMKEARIDGLFAIIGDFTGAKEAVIGEGYATLDSVNQASGLPCIVAFNTSNLPKVARLWAAHRPDMDFIVFADDDAATREKMLAQHGVDKNPGIDAAEAVANEIGARVAYPTGRVA